MDFLHSPVVHFPIGGLFVATIAAVTAFLLHLLISNDKIPEKILKIFGKDILTKLDFVTHISVIIGLLGIIIAVITGILDASGAQTLIFSDFSLFFTIFYRGITNSLSNTLLTYKICIIMNKIL